MRATRERLEKDAGRFHLQPSLAEADEQGDESDLHPCVICGRLLGLHSDPQIFGCSKKLRAEIRR